MTHFSGLGEGHVVIGLGFSELGVTLNVEAMTIDRDGR